VPVRTWGKITFLYCIKNFILYYKVFFPIKVEVLKNEVSFQTSKTRDKFDEFKGKFFCHLLLQVKMFPKIVVIASLLSSSLSFGN